MAPLAARSEQVRHVQDDQVRHPGVPAVASVGQVSWPRYSLSAQPLRLDECPGVGDPIDVLAHLLESLCAGSGELPPLRSEYEHGLAALVRYPLPEPRGILSHHVALRFLFPEMMR